MMMILNLLFGIKIMLFEISEERKQEKERKEVNESWKFWKKGGM